MKLKKRYALTGVSFTLPFLAGFALLYLIPFLWSIQKTFTAGAGGIRFAGLQNYADLFRSAALSPGGGKYLPVYRRGRAAADGAVFPAGAGAVSKIPGRKLFPLGIPDAYGDPGGRHDHRGACLLRGQRPDEPAFGAFGASHSGLYGLGACLSGAGRAVHMEKLRL